MAIASVVGWLGLSDLGIGQSMSVSIAKANAQENEPEIRKIIASGGVFLLVIALILASLGATYGLTNYFPAVARVSTPEIKTEMRWAFAIAAILFAINLPASIASITLNACQQFIPATIIAIIGNVLGFAVLVLVIKFADYLPFYTAAYAATFLAINIGTCWWYFKRKAPARIPRIEDFDLKEMLRLSRTGIFFFMLGVGWLINSQTDTVVIGRILGATDVTPYSVAWRLFNYTTIVQAVLVGLLTPSYTDAFAKADFAWIKKTFRLHLGAGVVITGFGCITLVIFGRSIIEIWAGPSAVPSQQTILWMAALTTLYAFTVPMAVILNSMGKPKGMALYGGLTAIVNIFLSIHWVEEYGITGVVAATFCSYLVISVIPSIIELRYRLNRAVLNSKT